MKKKRRNSYPNKNDSPADLILREHLRKTHISPQTHQNASYLQSPSERPSKSKRNTVRKTDSSQNPSILITRKNFHSFVDSITRFFFFSYNVEYTTICFIIPYMIERRILPWFFFFFFLLHRERRLYNNCIIVVFQKADFLFYYYL